MRKSVQTYEYFLTIRMAFKPPEYPIPIVATVTHYTRVAMAVFSPRAAVQNPLPITGSRLRLKCDGTRAETRFRLSAKRTNPFKSAGASVQSTNGSRGVRISGIVMLDTPCSEVV